MNNSSTGDYVGLKDNTTHWIDWPAVLAEYPAFQASDMMWKIWPLCVLLLGGFGNIATVFVMRRIKDHNSSQHTILTALAVSDLTLLCVATAKTWIGATFGVYIDQWHTVLCKVTMWMVYSSNTASAWLVTLVTVQRAMAVLWPHRMRVMCTVRRTWGAIGTLVLTVGIIDSHFLIGMIIDRNDCMPTPGMYTYFGQFVLSWLTLFKVCVLPGVCNFVCDVILAVTLLKAVSSSSIAARADSSASTAQRTDSRRKASYRTTVMVLAVSCAFLVLTLPVGVFVIWDNHTHNHARPPHPKTIVMRYLTQTLVFNLWYTNCAINFFLYCLTGTKFRREFMNWICCGAQSPSAPSVHETASEASRGGRHKHHGNGPLSK